MIWIIWQAKMLLIPWLDTNNLLLGKWIADHVYNSYMRTKCQLKSFGYSSSTFMFTVSVFMFSMFKFNYCDLCNITRWEGNMQQHTKLTSYLVRFVFIPKDFDIWNSVCTITKILKNIVGPKKLKTVSKPWWGLHFEFSKHLPTRKIPLT